MAVNVGIDIKEAESALGMLKYLKREGKEGEPQGQRYVPQAMAKRGRMHWITTEILIVLCK